MASRQPRSKSHGVSSAASRFKLILERLFQGNQSRMAEAIGITQPMASLILSGRHKPGPRTLALLASLPQVNAQWVYSGEGEPFRPTAKRRSKSSAAASALFLPIARAPLTAEPENPGAMFTGQIHPTTAECFSPTRYWLEVVRNEVFSSSVCEELHLQESDLILIETDDPTIHDPNYLTDRLCIVTADKGKLRLVRCCWDYDPETGASIGMMARFVGVSEDAIKPQGTASKASSFREQFASRLETLFDPTAIRGVAVMMIRRTL